MNILPIAEAIVVNAGRISKSLKVDDCSPKFGSRDRVRRGGEGGKIEN